MVGLLLLSFFKLGVSTAQAGENDDIKVLLELEGKMAEAWVRRDTQFGTTSAIVDDLRIRLYGDPAVVTGRATYRGWSKKRGSYVRRFRFTDTFIRRVNIWKCVATHASGLGQE